MNISFYGGARSVTGANYLVEANRARVLVDCGLMQGCRLCEAENRKDFLYDPAAIQALIITHAHLDHVGRAPRLIQAGFRGPIYMTPPTRAFLEPIFEDGLNIMAERLRREGEPPLYDAAAVERFFRQAESVPYGQTVALAGGLRFKLHNAGHILGSAIVELWNDRRRAVFSGDLGGDNAPLLPPPARLERADAVLVESTYGDRLHENTAGRKDRLEDAIEAAVTRGGTLLIAAFALERTQELLYELNELVEHRRIPSLPVFVDSPLAIKLTRLYPRFEDQFDQEARRLIRQGEKLFDFPGLRMTESVEASKAINEVPPPKVIVAGSGMSTGGRILHHERRYLPGARNELLVTGYQAAGTRGRDLLDGARRVTIFNQELPVRARVEAIGGYSAHADQAALLKWLSPLRRSARRVYAVQGEPAAARALAVKIRDRLGLAASVPLFGDRATV